MKVRAPSQLRFLHGWHRVCLLVSFLGVLSGCGALKVPGTAEQVAPRNVNVVVITLDTTRADHLSCYAADAASVSIHHARTPHLDALAGQGARFVHAAAQVPLTLPSHACIFTGVYPTVHGLRDMGGFVFGPQPTLAAIAHQAGFQTAAFVGSKAVAQYFGLGRGFDLYDDRITMREDSELPGRYPRRPAAATTDLALHWLQEHASQRFFVWVHYYDPHEPYAPPEPYKSQYPGDSYSGAITYTDAQAGRIIDFLDHSRLRDRTLVIVMGDHGEGLFEHGEETHGIFTL